MKTRNLTMEEVKIVFYMSLSDVDLTDEEVKAMPRRFIEFASACGRNGIIMFCEANDIPLPEGFPGRNDEQATN